MVSGRGKQGAKSGSARHSELTSTYATEIEPLPLRCAIRALIGCAWRTAILVGQRRIRQPSGNVGRAIRFADGTGAEVYRETVIDRPAAVDPVVLVVCFRLRWVRWEWGHALFRFESELNTILFAGFPGLVSKLWLRRDEQGLYRGFYQWDGPGRAVAYVRALWWALVLVSDRDSIHYVALPGLERDAVLRDPALVDATPGTCGQWWLPAGVPTGAT